eukprot:54710-Hanusia_phi.AAC.2
MAALSVPLQASHPSLLASSRRQSQVHQLLLHFPDAELYRARRHRSEVRESFSCLSLRPDALDKRLVVLKHSTEPSEYLEVNVAAGTSEGVST